MKAHYIIVGFCFTCVVSIFAQGQIVQRDLSLTQADETSALIVPLFSTSAPPAPWLASGFSDLSGMEASRLAILTDANFSPALALQPFVVPANPPLFQTSSLPIQAVPEPSSLALGSLAIALFGVRFLRSGKTAK